MLLLVGVLTLTYQGQEAVALSILMSFQLYGFNSLLPLVVELWPYHIPSMVYIML